MIKQLQKAKSALNQMTITGGENNAVLYVVAHQCIDEAMRMAQEMADAKAAEQEGSGGGEDGN